MFDQNHPQVVSWLAGAQAKIDAEFARRFPNLEVPVLVIEPGRRYLRIVEVQDRASRSAFAFIDQTNGDVLKAATWKAPAKTARGNITDESNGLSKVSAWGPMYLR